MMIYEETRNRDYYVQLGKEMTEAEAKQRQTMRQKRFDTIAVHGIYGAQAALQNQGSIIEPGYFSSAQHFENSNHMEVALAYEMPSWAYTRIANPTLHYLEETIAMLEGYGNPVESSAVVTSSGMAAVFMATNPFLVQDDKLGTPNIVVSAKCYGGAFMLFNQRYGVERGIDVRWVRDPMNLDEWAENIDENTRFVYGEMPSNPALAVFDIANVAKLAHAQQTPLIVDSTVATAALMRPLCHGADIIVHSVSKSMASSGFTIAGAIIARHNIISKIGSDEMRQNFALYVKLLPLRDHGPGLSPFNALMILNDLRTLRHRMDYLSTSSLQVAEYLAAHPMIEAVNYPGLRDSAAYEMASHYMMLVDSEEQYGQAENRYGHLMSFNVAGGHKAARKVFDNLQMIWRATDLGRIKSVATIPTISTHQQQGDSGRELAGVPANQIRLSIGAEHSLDIIDDLEQALATL